MLHLVFPPRCIACGETVASDFGLCAKCWGEAGFIAGSLCDLCGKALPGIAQPGERLHCDACLADPPPWARGRAALSYAGTARQLVLGLKHGDRLDLARPLGKWLAQAAMPLLEPDMIVAPVPLHRWRLLARRYNQSALLAGVLAAQTGLTHIPDLLLRPHATASQDGRSREERFRNLSGRIAANPRRRRSIRGRSILVVDDVLTSGATLSAATEALLSAGARRVCIAALARVAPEP